MALGVVGLYARDGKLVATVRAQDYAEARALFQEAGLDGARMRWIAPRDVC